MTTDPRIYAAAEKAYHDDPGGAMRSLRAGVDVALAEHERLRATDAHGVDWHRQALIMESERDKANVDRSTLKSLRAKAEGERASAIARAERAEADLAELTATKILLEQWTDRAEKAEARVEPYARELQAVGKALGLVGTINMTGLSMLVGRMMAERAAAQSALAAKAVGKVPLSRSVRRYIVSQGSDGVIPNANGHLIMLADLVAWEQPVRENTSLPKEYRETVQRQLDEEAAKRSVPQNPAYGPSDVEQQAAIQERIDAKSRATLSPYGAALAAMDTALSNPGNIPPYQREIIARAIAAAVEAGKP